MRDFIRLIILILFLPVIILLIGPLLVLAALRGRQWMGPITLNSARYGLMGRAGMFLLGAALWILVWSGLAWLTFQAVTPVSMQVALPSPTPAAAQANVDAVTPRPATAQPTLVVARTVTLTATASPSPTATPAPPSATPTTAPTDTATATSTATASPTASRTPTPEPLPTDTATATASPTRTPTAAPTATSAQLVAPTLAPRPLPTVPLADRRAAIAAVNRANDRLRQAIIQASDENLESLGEVWQGKAFTLIEGFAVDMNQRYAQPVAVDYRYVESPAIGEASVPGQIIVTTTEAWAYGSSAERKQETLEFIYTLTPIDGEWVIARYTYRNLPQPRTPVPSATPTATPASTVTLEY